MTITVTQFKAHCLGLFDTLAKQSEEIIVTKRGKPIAKVVPASAITDRSSWKDLRGTAHFTCGDLFSDDDRVIVATALQENLTVVTRDERILSYPHLNVLPC